MIKMISWSMLIIALIVMAAMPGAAGDIRSDKSTTNADSIKGKPINTTPTAAQDGMYMIYSDDTVGFATPAGGGDANKSDIGDTLWAHLDDSTAVLWIAISDSTWYALSAAGDTLWAHLDDSTGVLWVAINDSTQMALGAISDSLWDHLGDYLPLAGGTMSGDIDMGDQDIFNVEAVRADTADIEILNFNPISTAAYLEGRVYYDSDDNTLNYYNDESDVTMNIGQELWLPVRNNTGSIILDGSVVYITSAFGSVPTIALAKADVAATAGADGIATHDIEDGTNGYMTIFGHVRGLDTDSLNDGDDLYLSSATAGAYTSDPAGSSPYLTPIGTVVFAHASSGVITVNITISSAGLVGDSTSNYYTQTYIDATFLPLAGGTMSGGIDMGDEDIFNIERMDCDSIIISSEAFSDLTGSGLNVSGANALEVTWEDAAGLDTDGGVTSGHVLLNEIGNPSADKTFTMTKDLKFTFTGAGGGYDGGIEVNVTGNYSGDLMHLHQHTGNPPIGDMLHIESEDADIINFHSTVHADADTNAGFDGGIVYIDRVQPDTIDISDDVIIDMKGTGLGVTSNALHVDWTWIWEFIDSTTSKIPTTLLADSTIAVPDSIACLDIKVDTRAVIQAVDGDTVIADGRIMTKNGADGAGMIDFFEDSDNGSNYVRLIGPASTADITLTLPFSDGDNTQVLQTDGSGVMSWVANAGAGHVDSIKTNADNITDLQTEPRYLLTIMSPNSFWVADSFLVPVDTRTAVAITVTRIDITCDAAANDLDFDLLWADAFIGNANRDIIDEMNTSSGVLASASIDDGTVPANKCVYIRFNAEPHADILSVNIHVTYTID